MADPQTEAQAGVIREVAIDAPAMSAPEHRVVISDSPGGRFCVTIEPALTEGEPFDQTFDSHRAARGYAGGIRMTRAFAIRDLTVFAGVGTEQGARL